MNFGQVSTTAQVLTVLVQVGVTKLYTESTDGNDLSARICYEENLIKLNLSIIVTILVAIILYGTQTFQSTTYAV
jgi:hypothetical protein